MMPFTREAFFGVFSSYNETIWPAQVLLLAAAIAAVFVPRWRRWIVSALWVWCAIAFFWTEFTAVTPAAWIFGAIFLAGAFMLFDDAGGAEQVSPLHGAIGAAFIVYALVLYPLIGYFAGHRYPAIPTFGAPCPLTIFTIGLLVATRRRPIAPAIAPLIWCAIGGSAAFAMGVPQDLALPVAGVTLAAVDIQETFHERHRMLHA